MRYLALLFIILSCNSKIEAPKTGHPPSVKTFALTPTFQRLQLSGEVEDSIKSFLREDTCTGCLHELYVDKVNPDYTILVLKSRAYSTDYLRTKNPLFTTTIGDQTFSVFTGLEDIFTGDKANSLPVGDSTTTNFRMWSLYLEGDSIRVEKTATIPFFPSIQPSVQPEIDVKKYVPSN